MSEAIYNKLIVVYDYENMGVICSVTSDAVAASLCLGLLNCRWKSLSRNRFIDKMIALNFDDVSNHYQINITVDSVTVEPLLERLITEDWTEKRKLVLEKKRALITWEWHCRSVVSRVNEYFGMDSMMPYLLNQLNKSDPESGQYAAGIQEWALIQEISPDAAYRELSMKSEGIGINYLRNHAMYDKTSRKIAMASSRKEIWDHFADGVKFSRQSLN